MRLPKSPTFSLHLAVLLFGLSALFGRWLMLPAVLIALGRTVFGSITLAALATARDEKLEPKKTKDYIPLLGSGAVLAFHWTAFFHSVQSGSVAIATLTFATFPIITAFAEPFFFREKFHAIDLIAALGAFMGVALMSWSSHTSMAGVLWGMASAASFAALSLINRGRVRFYPGRVVAFYQSAGAAICLMPFLFTEHYSITLWDISLLIFLGVFCTALAHSLYIQSMKRITATTAGLVACLEPVYAIILAAILLGEPLTWRVIASGALILGSAMMPGRVKDL